MIFNGLLITAIIKHIISQNTAKFNCLRGNTCGFVPEYSKLNERTDFMKSKLNKFLSVVIALCMVMTLLPISSITASAASYGTFYVSGSDATVLGRTVTIRRTGGTDGAQKVYYRTVSQSAIAGTHYESAYGSITFKDGEDVKTVTVKEYGSTTSQIYGGRHSTGYSNAARTYRFEIYQVSGGAALGDTTSATITMGEPTKISTTLFTASHTKDIKAAEVVRGDYDDDNLGWGIKGIGTKAYESINIMNSIENRAYWEEVAEYLTFDVSVDIKEYNSGYQHIVLAEGSTFNPLIYPNDGKFVDKDGNTTLIGDTSDSDGIFYSTILEHGGGGSADKNYKTYTIDAIIDEDETEVKSAGIDSNYRSTDGHFIIKQKTDGHIAVKDDTLMVGFSGSGSGHDQFYTKNLKLINLRVRDTKQPRYLGIAPVEGNYRPGDKLTLSVVFDEIVTEGTSTMLSTPWGDFEYSGGVNTNILYYTGKVPDDAVEGTNTLSDCSLKYSSKISDMVGNRGTLGQAMSVNVNVVSVHTHCSCGLETDVCDTEYSDHHKDIDFPVWEPTNRMPILEQLHPEDDSAGPKVYYYLANDVTLSDMWDIQNEGKVCNVSICLDGHTITNTNSSEESPVIDIWRSGRLYLTTCGMDGNAEITHAEGTSGSGVQVGGQTDITSRNKGYFYMYGGNIVRNTTGGVIINESGTFEMHRGTITDNTNDTKGLYEVYNKTGGTFTMYGGTISSNSSTAISNYGNMTVSGGTISGNNAIHNFSGGTLALSGSPEISGTSGVDIFCYSTAEGQIDADGYTGDTLTIAISDENVEALTDKVIIKNATADKFSLVNSANGQVLEDYVLEQSGNDLILTEVISWPTGLSGETGKPLSTIELPDGFAWERSTQIIDYERREYLMIHKSSGSVALVGVEAIDKTPPTGTISIGDKTWSSFVEKENISFDVFYNTKQTVKITAEDESYGSGVDEVYYYLSTKARTKDELTSMAITSWKQDVFEFDIQPDNKYIIYVRILDEATKETIISTDGIVLDSKAPVISGITDGETYFGDTEVTVSDTYFDKVEVDGIETAVTDGKFTVKPASGTQKIIAYDKAGNTTTCNITVTVPEIMIYNQSVTGSGTSYEYSFEMLSPQEVNGVFIVALYDEENRLVGVETIKMNTVGKTYSATNSILTDSPANTYKIMFCSGLDTLIPLCDAAEGDIVIEQ